MNAHVQQQILNSIVESRQAATQRQVSRSNSHSTLNEEEQINEILQMNDHDMENSSNNSLQNDSDRIREQRIQRLRQFGRQAANEAQN